MKKMVYIEKDRRDIVNCYGNVTGEEYDVFFDDLFIGTVSGNSYGIHGCCTGLFAGCKTTTPLTEIAEKMDVELVDIDSRPIAKCW